MIKFGSNGIDTVKIGSEQIQRVALGTETVWEDLIPKSWYKEAIGSRDKGNPDDCGSISVSFSDNGRYFVPTFASVHKFTSEEWGSMWMSGVTRDGQTISIPQNWTNPNKVKLVSITFTTSGPGWARWDEGAGFWWREGVKATLQYNGKK